MPPTTLNSEEPIITYPHVNNLSGCAQPIRMRTTYPDAHNLSGCERMCSHRVLSVAALLYSVSPSWLRGGRGPSISTGPLSIEPSGCLA